MASQHVADQNNVIASDMAMGNVFPISSPHPALFLAPCTFTLQHRGGSQNGGGAPHASCSQLYMPLLSDHTHSSFIVVVSSLPFPWSTVHCQLTPPILQQL